MYCFNRPEKNIHWPNLHLLQMTILARRGHRVFLKYVITLLAVS